MKARPILSTYKFQLSTALHPPRVLYLCVTGGTNFSLMIKFLKIKASQIFLLIECTIGLFSLKSILPLWRPTKRFLQWECDLHMDWHIEQLKLKFTPPLCNSVVQCTTEGVNISHGSAQWPIPCGKCLH